MQVTDVRIQVVEDRGKLKANASVTFDDILIVRDFRIVLGSNGVAFVDFPSRKVDGKYYKVVFSLDQDFEARVNQRVLDEWANQE